MASDSKQHLIDKKLPILEVIEALPNGLIVVDSLGRIVLCNEEIENQFGYPQDELVGQPVDVLIPEPLRPQHPKLMQTYFDAPQKRAMGEGRKLFGRHRTGREFPIEIGLNPVTTEGGLYVLAAVVDISKRCMEEEKFRMVVESSPNGLIMVDASQTIIQVNTQAAVMFGCSYQALLGQKLDTLIPERFRPHHGNSFKEFMARPEVRAMGSGRDLYGLRMNGEEFPIEIGLTPLTVDGQWMVLATVVDITERKKIEEAIRLKTQEMEQFVYIVSHDLKSPIVTSMSFLQFLREDLPADISPGVLDSVGRLERANRRMSQLIDDLLRLSRVGQIQLHREEVDLRELILEVWSDLETYGKPEHLDFQIEDPLPILSLDRFRMRQLFENLLTNSLKYGMGHQQPTISVGARDEGRMVWIFIRDNGDGIAPEHHRRIFGLFERLDTGKEGTGVGLAIVARVAALHGGRAWVESKPGEGATFFLSLPKSPPLTQVGG